MPAAIHDELSSSSFTVADGGKRSSEMGKPKIRRRHSVDFKNGHSSFEIDKPDEMEALDIWYTRQEYDIMKARNSLIVKMMKSGKFCETEEHSFRGLEHKLKGGFKQRRSNKFGALNAVLEEQDRQFNRNFNKPEIIAEAYRRVSLNARENAFVIGQRDAEGSYAFKDPQPRGSLGRHLSATSAANDSDGEDPEDDLTDIMSVYSEDTTAKKNRLRRLFSGVSRKRGDPLGGTSSRRSSM